MPGTGQAPLKVDVGAERIYSRALDYLANTHRGGRQAHRRARPELERLLGCADRVQGARSHSRRVVHGVGIHGYFQPEWQSKGLTTREYLFDLFPARSAVYGVNTMEEFLAYGPRLSLLDAGLSGQAVGAHVARQRREGHPAADRGPVSDDEAWRSQGRVGQPRGRAHGPLAAVAAGQLRSCPNAGRDGCDLRRAFLLPHLYGYILEC